MKYATISYVEQQYSLPKILCAVVVETLGKGPLGGRKSTGKMKPEGTSCLLSVFLSIWEQF